MTFPTLRPIFSSLLVSCALVGCGPAGPVRVPVTGVVTWQTQPVPEGDILFEVDGQPDASAHGKIVNGEYKLKVTPGLKKVRIHATREEGEVDPIMQARPRKPYIPIEYNFQTKLTAEVQVEGENKLDFTLPFPP